MTEAATASNITPITAAVKTVQTYQTPDGQFFTTEAEALRHIAKAKFASRADAYINAHEDWANGSAGRARNIICDFLAFEEAQK